MEALCQEFSLPPLMSRMSAASCRSREISRPCATMSSSSFYTVRLMQIFCRLSQNEVSGVQFGFLLCTYIFSSATCLLLLLLHPFPDLLLHSKRGLLFNGSLIKSCSQQAPVARVSQVCSTSASGAAANNLSGPEGAVKMSCRRHKQCNPYKIKAQKPQQQ